MHIESDNRECDHAMRPDWILKPDVIVSHSVRFSRVGPTIAPTGRDMRARQ